MPRTIAGSVLPLVLCSIVAALSGCTALYDDTCGPVGRDVTTLGHIPMGAQDDTLAQVQLTLAENEDDFESRSAYWYVVGQRLRGHVQAARLVTSEDTSRVALQLTGVPSEPDVAIEGQIAPYIGAMDFNELFNRARSGGLTAVLETDLPSFNLLALPLTEIAQFNDWGKAHCS